MSHPSTSSGTAVPVISGNHTIVSIPPAPPVPQPELPKPKLPELDLVHEGKSREEYINVGIPLYEAALKGDWKAAEPILKNRLDLVRYAITGNKETLLHVAASAERTKAVDFVENLVKWMKKEDLELQNNSGETALSLAAQAGNIETAKIMVKKNRGLIEIPNNDGLMPLYMAALFTNAKMVSYLYDNSNQMRGDYWSDRTRGWVLQKCVEGEIFDVAIKIVNDRTELTVKKGLLTEILLALAQNTKVFEGEKPNFVIRIVKSSKFTLLAICSYFVETVDWPREKQSELALQLLKLIWEKIAKMPKTAIDDILRGPSVVPSKENKDKECEALPCLQKILEKLNMFAATVPQDKEKSEITSKSETVPQDKEKSSHPTRVLFVAAKSGNTRFITEIIRLYPDAIWKVDDKGKTIFHLAIKRRQAKIYNLLYEIGAMKDLITPMKDAKGNNMLHMVAKSGKENRFQDLSGVVLQMQRELLWFKEVEQMIPPQYRQKKNKAGETPKDLFTKKHADLVTKGKEWMKDTASQCMVAATLIATIVFAAAFTLPGGYNQDTGIPFFRKEPSLIIFVIADAISLISSSTSVLIFLSILTSRYAEHDFVASLPHKLIFGIATLFLSIVTMMVAFSASFFVLYNKKVEWVPITITSLAVLPVILFIILQFRLVKDVYYSTYGSKYLFKPKKRFLYY
ncbi:uncharacterized protein LOC143616885 [Bidens hawaiensis]|uniref:uncharacterized protein LOC143616885 n=1 Tax=Bidens hawaiensis TaxID=980011 RepID=UPI00404AFD24